MPCSPKRCAEGDSLRNFACPHYADCLDQAVAGWWEGFTCQGCSSAAEVRADWEGVLVSDQEGLGALAAAILCMDSKLLRFQLKRS
jgi:hypothetical protein